jgi:hypothetical protein
MPLSPKIVKALTSLGSSKLVRRDAVIHSRASFWERFNENGQIRLAGFSLRVHLNAIAGGSGA